MNALRINQEKGTSRAKEPAATIPAVDLTRLAKPIGTFGSTTDFILRFRNGKLVAENTADQGGGQNQSSTMKS